MLPLLKTALLAFGLFLAAFAPGSWGADGVSDSNRTSQDWERAFPQTPTVVVGPTGDVATIAEGISSCYNLPASAYCFVQVQAGTYRVGGATEVYIPRSRTKLSGSTSGVTRIESTEPHGVYLGNLPGQSLDDVVVENLFVAGEFDGEPVYTSRTGIFVNGGNMENLSIRNNTVDGFQADMSIANGAFIAGASAIAIDGRGASEETAIRNLVIENNTVTNMKNGYSENITINGNVTRWEIRDNTVDNVTNIGIDAIGGENVSPTFAVNAARNGFIENNTVTNLAEPPTNTEGVAAIYVDGGRDIHIEGNYVDVTSHGYTIGAENCVATSNVTMINNVSLNAVFEDLTVGGYSTQGYTFGVDSECDGSGGGHGSVENITVTDNYFDSPDAAPLNANSSNFPVQMNYRVTSAIINQQGVIEVNQNGRLLVFLPVRMLVRRAI